jgi:hypothetical protein
MSDYSSGPWSSIDEVDEYLAEWASALLGTVTVTLDPPQAVQPGRGVSFYLYGLADRPPPRNAERAPLQLSLRYLVTTWAQEQEAMHRLLDKLVFAAMGDTAFEVELSPPAAEIWTALGVAPQPSFVLGALVRRERPEPEAPLVRMPLEVRYASITELRGTVLGPGDVALMGALVELPALQIRTRTDARGRFRFAAVPRDPKELHLLVQAKGRQFQVVVEQDGADGEPVVIRVGPFDRKEN